MKILILIILISCLIGEIIILVNLIKLQIELKKQLRGTK